MDRAKLNRVDLLAPLLAVTMMCGCGRQPTSPSPATEADISLHTNRDALPVLRSPKPDDWFEDITQQSGIRFSYDNGRSGNAYTIVETIGGGVAMIDYDQDGDLDLFFPGGGEIAGSPPVFNGLPCALYCNDGAFKFTDVTKAALPADATDYSLGCSVSDFDRDGFPDILVTCYGSSRLFHNNQDGTFDDVAAEAGLTLEGFYTATTWADVDQDGCSDLYVTGYVKCEGRESTSCVDSLLGVQDTCGPLHFPALSDRLFRNAGNGSFDDVTANSGINDQGKGLGVVASDFDQDGWLDFYVANDTVSNQLYFGIGNLQFMESAVVSGAAVGTGGNPEGSMGVAIGDVNADGLSELFITNFEMEDNSLYSSIGGRSFDDITSRANLRDVCRRYIGFGTGFADFDSDGWQDLYVINGSVHYRTGQMPYEQPSFLFRNDDGRFSDISDSAAPYFGGHHVGRGAAAGDLDNDGMLDLVIVHHNANVKLLRNRQAADDWLRIRLKGRSSSRDSGGARVSIDYDGRKLLREVNGANGYLSYPDQRVLLPLENHGSHRVAVQWPDGQRESFENVPAKKTTTLVQGGGRNGS